jgi:membrane fusion protein, hemolysin D
MPDFIRKYKEQNTIRRDFEFMPATIEVLERPPAPFSRVIILILVALAVFVITWAFIAKIDIVASGTGVVVPKGRVKIIQPLEPGIITEIAVSDGQLVKKGELLVRMDSTESHADLKSLKRELIITQLAVSRLSAQLAEDSSLFTAPKESGEEEILLQRRLLDQSLLARKEKMAVMDRSVNRAEAELISAKATIEWLEKSLPLAEKLHEKKRIMAEKEMLASGKYLQAQMEINGVRKNLGAEKNRMAELELSLSQRKDEKLLWQSEYKKGLLTELTDTRKKQETLVQHLAKAKNKFTNRELRSPTDGIVQQLAINTIGGVVTSAQPLMTIVPMDIGLEIEAKLLNKDIGFVSTGQHASIKVAAYPFTRHGDLAGTIEWVGRDAVMDEQLGPVYPIRVSVSSYQLPNRINGKQGHILPGMTVTSDIKVGKRRVIHYFLGPMLRYKDKSLREL